MKLVQGTNLTVIDSTWFHGSTGTIGVVLCEDLTLHYTKAYIGVGTGKDQEADQTQIAQYGSKIAKGMAESLFGPQPEWKD